MPRHRLTVAEQMPVLPPLKSPSTEYAVCTVWRLPDTGFRGNAEFVWDGVHHDSISLCQNDRMTTANGFEPLLEDAEASSLLGVHPKTLQKLARKGEIPAYRVGRFWRYRASELDVWLRSKAKSPRQPADRVDFTKDGV